MKNLDNILISWECWCLCNTTKLWN